MRATERGRYLLLVKSRILTPSEASDFYQRVCSLCRQAPGLERDERNEISTEFFIATAYGPLRVSVANEEWIPRLGYNVQLQLAEAPTVFPAVDGLQYDNRTGKWCIHEFGRPHAEVIAQLKARLAWAVGSEVGPALAMQQSAFAF